LRTSLSGSTPRTWELFKAVFSPSCNYRTGWQSPTCQPRQRRRPPFLERPSISNAPDSCGTQRPAGPHAGGYW
jgi:hypothetical protein